MPIAGSGCTFHDVLRRPKSNQDDTPPRCPEHYFPSISRYCYLLFLSGTHEGTSLFPFSIIGQLTLPSDFLMDSLTFDSNVLKSLSKFRKFSRSLAIMVSYPLGEPLPLCIFDCVFPGNLCTSSAVQVPRSSLGYAFHLIPVKVDYPQLLLSRSLITYHRANPSLARSWALNALRVLPAAAGAVEG
jgi:hypothetical protein